MLTTAPPSDIEIYVGANNKKKQRCEYFALCAHSVSVVWMILTGALLSRLYRIRYSRTPTSPSSLLVAVATTSWWSPASRGNPASGRRARRSLSSQWLNPRLN